MTFVHSWPSSWLPSIVLQVNVSMMEGLVCTYMGNSMAFLWEARQLFLLGCRHVRCQPGGFF